MSIFDTYPKYFKNSIKQVSDTGYICIVTFWTKIDIIYDKIIKELDKNNIDKILVIGNLYTTQGIKYIIKNTYLCKQIKYFVFCGNDINNVYDKFVNKTKFNDLVINDIDYSETFYNFYSTDNKNIIKTNIATLIDTIKNLSNNDKQFINDYVYFNDENIVNKSIPNEEIGYIIRDRNLYKLWQKALTKINLFGTLKQSDNDKQQKELLGLVSIITSTNILDDIEEYEINKIPNIGQLQDYIPLVCSSTSNNADYTYGERLFGENQIKNIIDELTKHHYSRRCISLTYRIEKDSTSKNPPCLILIDCKIQNEKLYMTCYFRSHDIYNAYCLNIIALQYLQKYIIDNINKNDNKLSNGYLMIVSNSAHVYEHDFDNIINCKSLECNIDPRGYFVISIDNKNINVNMYDLHDNLLKTFSNSSVHVLMDEMQPYISLVSHAMYIGKELQKAKYCIQNNIQYVQK